MFFPAHMQQLSTCLILPNIDRACQAHLEEGQSDTEQDLGTLQEQDIPDAYRSLRRQCRAEQAAEPAPRHLLQSMT